MTSRWIDDVYKDVCVDIFVFRLQLSFLEDNPFLGPIIEAVPNVVQPETTYTLKSPFALALLLPTQTTDFYRYEGSLTTPDCSEVVTWFVLRKRVIISEKQVPLTAIYSQYNQLFLI
jgi:carbonic anhydrase